MDKNFYEKMLNLQQYQPPAQPLPSRAGQNNRITVDDVRARGISSAIFGLLAFMVVLILSVVFEFHWLLALGAGLVTFGWFYFAEMADAKLYQSPQSPIYDYQREMLPQQPPQITRITAEVKTQNGMQIAEFQCDSGALRIFAEAVTRGKPFSEKTAGTAGISQTQFNAMRDQFIKLGWAEWKNPAWPKAGVKLLESGQIWIEKAASPSPAGQNH